MVVCENRDSGNFGVFLPRLHHESEMQQSLDRVITNIRFCFQFPNELTVSVLERHHCFGALCVFAILVNVGVNTLSGACIITYTRVLADRFQKRTVEITAATPRLENIHNKGSNNY